MNKQDVIKIIDKKILNIMQDIAYIQDKFFDEKEIFELTSNVEEKLCNIRKELKDEQ